MSICWKICLCGWQRHERPGQECRSTGTGCVGSGEAPSLGPEWPLMRSNSGWVRKRVTYPSGASRAVRRGGLGSLHWLASLACCLTSRSPFCLPQHLPVFYPASPSTCPTLAEATCPVSAQSRRGTWPGEIQPLATWFRRTHSG